MTRSRISAVVIGRNEGERLRACLNSVIPHADQTVYVDSGSTDGSIELAKQLGAVVIELSSTTTFTAARGRNAGWRRLVELADAHQLDAVQFVDGDCILNEAWIEQAATELAANPQAAIIFGHVREEWSTRNIYHRLAAMEWDTPVGIVPYCGGIALIRVSALKQMDGYNDALIAGEEPELCVRFRQAGWSIIKLDCEMALHDSDIGSFAEWWRRLIRSGRAYAEGAALHGAGPQKHWVHESRSIWIWGAMIPFAALVFAWWTCGISMLIAALLYAALFIKTLIGQQRQRKEDLSSSAIYAGMCVFAKLPQAIGQGLYLMRRKGAEFSTMRTTPNATSAREV